MTEWTEAQVQLWHINQNLCKLTVTKLDHTDALVKIEAFFFYLDSLKSENGSKIL